MSSKRSTFISELEIQAVERRKDWKRVWGTTDQFSEPDKQKRYGTLQNLISMLNAMTDKEVESYFQRIERGEQDKKSIQSLF